MPGDDTSRGTQGYNGNKGGKRLCKTQASAAMPTTTTNSTKRNRSPSTEDHGVPRHGSHGRITEQIIGHLRELYTQPRLGLMDIACKVQRQLLPPREKITVLLLGNHSAGKSSFVNWYIEETLQKTGVAMETSQITLVTSGKRREQLGGEATMEAFPFIKELVEEAGLKSSIITEVSPSRQKDFPLITFIDTPGLVDGEMQYAFDIKGALLKLGALADLIVVFFDPIGQALSKRSLDIVEALQARCGDNHNKMRFYLSKADTAGSDKDRQKVITQVIQNMCRRPALNQVAFELPTIYIPHESDPLEAARVPNQIGELELRIKETINHVVQNSLNQFKSDCEAVLRDIDSTIVDHKKKRAARFKSMLAGVALIITGTLLLLGGVLATAALVTPGPPPWASAHGEDMGMTTAFAALAYNVAVPMTRLTGDSVVGQFAAPWTYAMVVVAVLLVGHALVFKRGKVLSTAELQALSVDRQTVYKMLQNNFKTLYGTYLGEAVDTACKS